MTKTPKKTPRELVAAMQTSRKASPVEQITGPGASTEAPKGPGDVVK